METAFVADALLFESGRDEERLHIACSVTPDGEVLVVQRSAGPLTAWCFEEPEHDLVVRIAASDAPVLLERLGMELIEQIPAALQIRFAGFEASARIREFCREAGIPYYVQERAIRR